MSWPEHLPDNTAIAAFVSEASPYPICEEQIEEMYIGCRAALRWTAVAELQPGPAESNTEEEARQAECDRRPPASMPPLLVDDGHVMDGNHRYRSLRKRGITHCWAYHVEAILEPTFLHRRQPPDDEGFCP